MADSSCCRFITWVLSYGQMSQPSEIIISPSPLSGHPIMLREIGVGSFDTLEISWRLAHGGIWSLIWSDYCSSASSSPGVWWSCLIRNFSCCQSLHQRGPEASSGLNHSSHSSAILVQITELFHTSAASQHHLMVCLFVFLLRWCLPKGAGGRDTESNILIIFGGCSFQWFRSI